MTKAEYLELALLLVVVVGADAAAAVALRRRFLPGASGSLARLAEAVLGLGVLLTTLELLGAVGLLRRGPVVATAVAVGVGTALLARRGPPPPAPAYRPLPSLPGLAVAAAVAAVAAVAAQWAALTTAVVRVELGSYDTNWYHLPAAARFVQDGSVTELHFTTPEWPDQFHPFGAEMLHALGMVLSGRSVLSPWLMAGWYALALLAGWALGRRWGAQPITLLAVAAVLATPEVAGTHPGAAVTDVPSLALFTAACAFLVAPERDVAPRPWLVLAAGAAGLALSTKATLLVPIAVLTVVAVLAERRGDRVRSGVAWLAALAVTGSFWYVRNLVLGGSPVPALDLGALGFATPHFAIVEERGFSIAHYIAEGEGWHDWFRPGLEAGLGRVWWLHLALATLGTVLGLLRRDRRVRVLAVVSAAAGVAYVVMPTSALGLEGAPNLFYVTLRYGFAFLILGLALLAVAPQLSTSRRRAGVAIVLCALVPLTLIPAHRTIPMWHGRHWYPAVGAASSVVVVAAAWRWARPWVRERRALSIAFAAAVAAFLGAAGYRVQINQVLDQQAQSTYAWAEGQDARIGIVGFDYQFPLYGTDLGNHVQYVGEEGRHGEFHRLGDCPSFRAALADGRYEYVAWDPQLPYVAHPEGEWLATIPGAEVVYEEPRGVTVWRLAEAPTAAGCPT